MAEILGVASGIAGLLSLTIEVYSTSAKYISGVKNASSTINEILRELKALKTILTELDKVNEHTESEKVFQDRTSSLLSIEDAEEYRDVLTRLQVKLLKQASQTGLSLKLRNFAWPFSEEKTRNMVDTLRRHIGIFTQALTIDTVFITSEILKEVRTLGQGQREKRSTEVLDWLSTLDMAAKQQDVLTRRYESTGKWFLENEMFLNWIGDDSAPILWCPGDPGVGKTVVTSIVVDHMSKYCLGSDAGLAYFYCDYQDQSIQTAVSLLANLIRQFVQSMKSIFKPLEELYESLEARRSKPAMPDLESLLHSVCQSYGTTYIIIDALDECRPDQRKILLPALRRLNNASVKVFVTSRQHAQDIERALQGQPRIEIRATEHDLRDYVASQVEQDEDLMDLLTDDLREKMISSISSGAGGMFLFAVLQTKRICDQMTIREVKRALDTMPTGLSELYDETLDRIRRQSPKRSSLGMTTLGWLLYVQRPILVDELRHALAVGYYKDDERQTTFDMDNLIRPHLLVDVCAGLVTIEEESQVIRLVHYTTQEYFKKHADSLFDGMNISIAGTCLTYLLFDEFSNGPCCDEELLKQRVTQFGFLEYASCYWGKHVRGPLESVFQGMILEFLGNDNKICAAAEALSTREREFFRWCNKFGEIPKDFGSLQVAASQGLDIILRSLLDKSLEGISQADGTFKTPAHWAAWRGHDSSLEILLESGVDLHILSLDGFNLLGAACDQGRENVVSLLLSKGFQVDAPGFGGAPALETAALMGHEKVVQILLNHGADVNLKNEYGETPLFQAAARGHHRIVELLLERGADPECANACGNTALHGAAFCGQEGVVKSLLHAGSNVNVRASANGGSPLHMAASQGHDAAVKLLLERGADIEARTNNNFETFRPLVERTGRCIPQMVRLNLCEEGATPLIEATMHGHEVVVDVLIKQGANIHVRDAFMKPLLCIAVISAIHNNKGGNRHPLEVTTKYALAILRRLLDCGADPLAQAETGLSAIHFAAICDQFETVQVLLAKGVDINLATKTGYTPLHYAYKTASTDLIKFLIKEGADTTSITTDGYTMIHMAAQGGKVDNIALALEEGAGIHAKDNAGRTPLLVSIWSCVPEAVQHLLDHGANIEDSLTSGITAIFFAAWDKEKSPTIPILIKAGAKLDVRDCEGFQPHHRAAFRGNDKALEFLLDAGVDMESRVESEQRMETLLILGTQAESELVVRLLLERGANVNETGYNGRTALHEAAEQGSLAICSLLVAKGADISATTLDLELPIHLAAKAGKDEVIRLLLEYGSPLDPRNSYGCTPLHIATWKRHLEVSVQLLDSGADIEAKGSQGQTAVYFASESGSTDIVRHLVNSGANLICQCTDGETPLEVAVKNSHYDVVKVLMEAIPDTDLDTSRLLDIAIKSGGNKMIYQLIEAMSFAFALQRGKAGAETVNLLIQHGALDEMAAPPQTRPSEVQSTPRPITNTVTPSLIKILFEGDWTGSYTYEEWEKGDTEETQFTILSTYIVPPSNRLQFIGIGKDLYGVFDVRGQLSTMGVCFVKLYQSVGWLYAGEISEDINSKELTMKGRWGQHNENWNGTFELRHRLVNLEKVNEAGETDLYVAVQAGNEEIVRFLLSCGADPNQKTSYGDPPSHRAAASGKAAILRLLLDAGADPDAVDNRLCTVLMWGSQFGSPKVVEMLLQTGSVEVNACAVDGDTALHCAALAGKLDIIEVLIKHPGLITDIRNEDGLTPKEFATKKQFLDCAKLLDSVPRVIR
ncbi:Ankyrin repeat-containing domain protein [Hyaloscypha variabilis]